jgi:hypothetical protein
MLFVHKIKFRRNLPKAKVFRFVYDHTPSVYSNLGVCSEKARRQSPALLAGVEAGWVHLLGPRN